MKNVVTATALSLGVLLASQAGAEGIQEQAMYSRVLETHSISVPYTGSDLATDSGRASLYGKIKRAAKQVCGPTDPRQAGGLKLAIVMTAPWKPPLARWKPGNWQAWPTSKRAAIRFRRLPDTGRRFLQKMRPGTTRNRLMFALKIESPGAILE